jgi:tryptophanyl-tRNA synthetase
MKRLVTGVKPTGDIHLGNYFAAIKPAVELQQEYESFIFVADIHALNSVTDAQGLRNGTLEVAKAYLAAGLDPERVTLFQQSMLPHGELAMMIGAQTGIGLLERAHAYKDAKAKNSPINFGLFSYPVLMAADILMYQAEIVPVGKDQHQHLEMAREIGERFNHLYGETFTLPQPLMHNVPTIPGLDGRKMSKSYNNVIGLFEEPDALRQKVMKIVTAPELKAPEEDTVFGLYKLVAPTEAVAALHTRYTEKTISYKEAKELLAEALITFVQPIQEKKAYFDAHEDEVKDILSKGATRAQEVASQTMQTVRERTGLLL